ncbi:MAG: hypothetical protein ACRDG5_05880 [Anaerolineales bacterium]
MFDNLRDLSDQPEEYEPGYDEILQEAPAPRLFGMTAGQRFVLSILLLASVTMVGILCLVVTGKVWI